MKKLGLFVIARAKEPSTWRGIAMLATMFGAPTGAVEPIVQFGLCVVGVLGLFPDKH
jgi:hypothetical protein